MIYAGFTFEDERGWVAAVAGRRVAGQGGQFVHLQMREREVQSKQNIWGDKGVHNGHTNYSKLTFVVLRC